MISILIVHWKTPDLLRSCLASIRQYCQDHQVIVVDNASDDGSVQMVQEEFPEVQLIASASNLGFAAGNNLAYQHAKGEWIWLLNPDTELLANTVASAVQFLQKHPRCGAVASCLIDAKDGSIQHSCRTFPSPAALWCEAFGLASRYPRSRRFGFYRMGWWNYDDVRQVQQPMASSLLIRRDAIEDSGGLFDEDFPIYFNDVDQCWRLQEHQWQIWYLPQFKVRHHGGASTRQRRAAMITESHRSLERFYKKHYKQRLNPFIYGLTICLIGASGWWRARRAGLR